MEKHGHPNDRMRLTLQDMGVAVFHGAMSTMVAVLVLGSSDSVRLYDVLQATVLVHHFRFSVRINFVAILSFLVQSEPHDDLGEDF